LNERFQSLYRQLGYRFSDERLLAEALTHRSAATRNNERLEFLGDALLNWLVAENLYHRCPDATEGELTRLRANLVQEPALAELATALNLGEHLTMGAGEIRTGGFRRHSILADTFEALLAAVFLDGGLDAAREVFLRIYCERLECLPDAESLKDAKTRLQEYLQARGLSLPTYQVIETTGQAHQQLFRVRCSISADKGSAEGTGASRRQAEQVAANMLLTQLKVSE